MLSEPDTNFNIITIAMTTILKNQNFKQNHKTIYTFHLFVLSKILTKAITSHFVNHLHD